LNPTPYATFFWVQTQGFLPKIIFKKSKLKTAIFFFLDLYDEILAAGETLQRKRLAFQNIIFLLFWQGCLGLSQYEYPTSIYNS
jgi:hypothetical protein